MGMLAEHADQVIGVDTHRDAHAAAVVATGTGAIAAQTTVAADAFGYKRLLRFARRHAHGRRVWAIESSGSYGAGLTVFLWRTPQTPVVTQARVANARLRALGCLRPRPASMHSPTKARPWRHGRLSASLGSSALAVRKPHRAQAWRDFDASTLGRDAAAARDASR